jgi:hypothetical protein
MLDRWLLNVQRQILHIYLEGGQVQQFIKYIQNCRRNITAGVMAFDCHWEIIES